jgi:hypothetical protein
MTGPRLGYLVLDQDFGSVRRWFDNYHVDVSQHMPAVIFVHALTILCRLLVCNRAMGTPGKRTDLRLSAILSLN